MKTIFPILLLIIFTLGIATPTLSEEAKEKSTAKETATVSASVSKKEEVESSEEEKADRRSGLQKLVRKLTREDGTQSPIAILTPLDYTTLNFTELAQETIVNAVNRYGKFDVRVVEYSPAALTLEEFRKVVTRFNVDVVIVSVLKPTNFDLFLYDKKTPYNIYAHSEILADSVQYQLTKPIVEEYTKVIVRRVLYGYMQDQYYELPREETRPFLNAEIPRFIASNRSLLTINREILSNYYASVSVGAAVSGGGSSLWTSNLVDLQLGKKIFGNYFAELNLDFFSYNAVGPSLKYMFANRDNPFRFTLGIGLAMLINQHTLNWDQTYSQGAGGNYIVPSVAFTFPIVEMHFKVESKLFVSLDGSKFVLGILPGMFYMF